MTRIPDPLDNQVREPTEPETQVARVSAETVAELRAKLIAACTSRKDAAMARSV